jgi:hypothetical protein
LGDLRELKVDPGRSGTFTSADGLLTATILTHDTDLGPTFEWTSDYGVDAVIAKGSNNADAFVYDPPKAEDFGDSNLHAPLQDNGKYAGLSHISFCYDIELKVTKDAKPSFTRTFDWTIDKSVKPASWDLFKGDSGTSKYTISVTKSAPKDSNFAVEGSITIKNPDPTNPAKVTNVLDVITQAGTINAAVTCPDPYPFTVPANGTVTCTYKATEADGLTGAPGTNKATVQTASDSKVKGGSGTAEFKFDNPTKVVNDSITVEDSFANATGNPWTFDKTSSVDYLRKFACGETRTVNNTATIKETGQSDSASVKVNCYDLGVKKDAQTSLTRTYKWTITKAAWEADESAKVSDLTLSVGQTYPVKYLVTVDSSGFTDSAWKVKGNITISNPSPINAELDSVSDVVSPDIAASVDCPSLSVPANGSLVCSYKADLTNANDRTNTATAKLKNNDYAPDGTATPSGTTDFSGSTPVSFASATITKVDDNVTVTDTNKVDPLGTANVSDAPKTFKYNYNVGPYDKCGIKSPIDNTATFTTDDTGTKGDAKWTINVKVPCTGCTLTIGYWKTHADSQSRRTNPIATFQVLDKVGGTIYLGTQGGAKTVAVDKTNVVSILNDAGSSNGIKKLYAQLLGAKLNIANGADPSAVQSTIDAADAFLANKNAADWDSLTKAQKNNVLSWMTKLDQYNNGLSGPGHCSESRTA